MPDPYLYDDVPVLKNKLGIKDDKVLDMVEAEQSRLSMAILYKRGFDDFSPAGLCEIHRFLFGRVYEWAGEYRIINIEKREKLLAGRSVWYSNDEDIPRELEDVFRELRTRDWTSMTRGEFVRAVTLEFPKLWRIHPFREGDTRTVVMMLTFFVEHHGYFMDQELMASCAGYVRDAFVMASMDRYSEFEHLERILSDAICAEPIEYTLESPRAETSAHERYEKYQKEKYEPQPHRKRED